MFSNHKRYNSLNCFFLFKYICAKSSQLKPCSKKNTIFTWSTVKEKSNSLIFYLPSMLDYNNKIYLFSSRPHFMLRKHRYTRSLEGRFDGYILCTFEILPVLRKRPPLGYPNKQHIVQHCCSLKVPIQSRHARIQTHTAPIQICSFFNSVHRSIELFIRGCTYITSSAEGGGVLSSKYDN